MDFKSIVIGALMATAALFVGSHTAYATFAVFPVTFELDTGTVAPTGTITLDDSDPLFGFPSTQVTFATLTTQYSLEFTDGTSFWAQDDALFNPFVQFIYFDASGDLFGLSARFNDNMPPHATGQPLNISFSSTTQFRSWSSNLGSGAAPDGYTIGPRSSGVPEPSSVLLAVIACMLLLAGARQRRRR